MKRIIEKNIALIITLTVLAFAFSSCATTYNPVNPTNGSCR